jgi:putative flippase GtrA
MRTLVLRYAAFAAVATAANLAAQRAVLAGGDTDGPLLTLAIAVGTAAGLVVKYVLDKHWIFFDASTGARAHGRKFGLYAVMGLVTTVIFWGTETAFWLIWRDHAMRELGAVLGLMVGYVVKYRLDRRFVFTPGGVPV